jgi:hypothetical protein
MRLAQVSTAAALLSCAAATAGEVPFAVKPVVTKEGAGARVAFAVSAPTDVEVAVLDAGGRVVRHLAAGMLGGTNAPPAPLQMGLAQSLTWDGRDDGGQPPPSTTHHPPFSIRLRIGLQAKLDGILAEKPAWIGDLSGMAVGPNSELYVYSSVEFSHRGHSRCLQVFSRDGKYLRTIMPPPANLPKEKLLAFNTTVEDRRNVMLNPPGNAFYPRNYFGTWPEFYPGGMGQLVPRLSADGHLLLMDHACYALVATDGSSPDGRFWRLFFKTAPSHYTASKGLAAASPDGKWLYLSGLRSAKAEGGKDSDLFPPGRIYRMAMGGEGAMEKFVDVPAGKDSFHGSPVVGCDCDQNGNLLVCDWGSGRVRVFDAAGKEVGGIAVDAPEFVLCHRKSGAVYVMSDTRADARSADRKLVKFSSWKGDSRKLAELPLPFRDTYIYYQETSSISFALDDQQDPPVIWVGQAHGHPDVAARKSAGVWRIEDRGETLAKTLDLIDLERNPPSIMPRMAVHPETDVLLYNDGLAGVEALNGLSGERVKLPFANAVDMGVGLDGNWYVQTGNGYSGPICRFDRDFKEIPVEGRPAQKGVPSNALCDVYGRLGAGFCSVGLAADPRGRLFSLQMYDFGAYNLAIFGPDGKPEDPGRMKDDPKMKLCPRYKSAIVGPIATACGGVQLDWQGNIYVGVKLLPQSFRAPAGFEDPRCGYSAMTGSIIKFGPNGGAVTGVPKDAAQMKKGEVVDQRWGFMSPVNYKLFVEEPLHIYPGLGCISGGFGDGCSCRQPMFQVDGWGRLFFPSAATCSVRIMDNGGALIQEFGAYGNIDSRGALPGELVKGPEIPLAWPESVGVSEKAIYVADVANRRILRLKKSYAAEERVEIK